MKSARDEILRKLANAPDLILPEKPDFNAPLYFPLIGELTDAFKSANEQINGITELFDTEKDLFTHLLRLIKERGWSRIQSFESDIQENLTKYGIPFVSGNEVDEKMEAGITGCEFLIARTGSAMVSSALKGARKMFVYPPVHIIIAHESQLVESLEQAYEQILEKYKTNVPSMITLITGPSRTADIEKTLVLGAHGPREMIILILK